jgi:3-oxochol-4-en-24-oyl-CoA dehydrogenase
VGFMPSDDARMLGAALERLLSKLSSQAQVREAMESASGYDPQLWRTCATEVGVHGIAIPVDAGGAGAGLTELGVVFEALGRALTCGPYLATIALATPALVMAVDPAAAAPLLETIAAGETIATLVWSGAGPAESELAAAGEAITGTASIVVDALAATVLVVSARAADGSIGVYQVDPAGPGVTREALTTLDSTRRLGRVHLEGAPALMLSADAGVALSQAFAVARLLLAAEQLGGAQQVFEDALDYAKTRLQFGRAIGSFQAVKHRCADMLVEIELARSLVYHALYAAAQEPPAAGREAAIACPFISDAYVRLAADNIQIHGGIGFTWEHSAHLYLKRAKSSQHLLGNPTRQRRQLAAELGLIGAGA